MIGREPPLDFFRRSGVTVAGDRGVKFFATLGAFVAFIWFVYHWKAGGELTSWWAERGLFPFQFAAPRDAASLADVHLRLEEGRVVRVDTPTGTAGAGYNPPATP